MKTLFSFLLFIFATTRSLAQVPETSAPISSSNTPLSTPTILQGTVKSESDSFEHRAKWLLVGAGVSKKHTAAVIEKAVLQFSGLRDGWQHKGDTIAIAYNPATDEIEAVNYARKGQSPASISTPATRVTKMTAAPVEPSSLPAIIPSAPAPVAPAPVVEQQAAPAPAVTPAPVVEKTPAIVPSEVSVLPTIPAPAPAVNEAQASKPSADAFFPSINIVPEPTPAPKQEIALVAKPGFWSKAKTNLGNARASTSYFFTHWPRTHAFFSGAGDWLSHWPKTHAAFNKACDGIGNFFSSIGNGIVFCISWGLHKLSQLGAWTKSLPLLKIIIWTGIIVLVILAIYAIRDCVRFGYVDQWKRKSIRKMKKVQAQLKSTWLKLKAKMVRKERPTVLREENPPEEILELPSLAEKVEEVTMAVATSESLVEKPAVIIETLKLEETESTSLGVVPIDKSLMPQGLRGEAKKAWEGAEHKRLNTHLWAPDGTKKKTQRIEVA